MCLGRCRKDGLIPSLSDGWESAFAWAIGAVIIIIVMRNESKMNNEKTKMPKITT